MANENNQKILLVLLTIFLMTAAFLLGSRVESNKLNRLIEKQSLEFNGLISRQNLEIQNLSKELISVNEQLEAYKRSFESFKANMLVENEINRTRNTTMNLVSWWHFNDDPADGVLVNYPSWTPGKRGMALQFNGSSQYLLLGEVLQDAYPEFSIACWVKHSSSAWQVIVERGTWDYDDGIGLTMDYLGQSVDFGHYGKDLVKSKANVQDNEWHHVVGTLKRSGEDYIYSIYVDGKLDNTYTGTLGITATRKGWGVGARYNGTWAYQGLIDDVRLYNRALTASEVKKLYRQ